jgi:uncharacterized protein
VNVPADCRRCGVCCFSEKPDYVAVTGADWARLGDAAERVAHFVGHRAFMRMNAGHCAALEQRDGGHCCTIYDRRPQVCRDLERGSPQCEAEITRKYFGVRGHATALDGETCLAAESGAMAPHAKNRDQTSPS